MSLPNDGAGNAVLTQYRMNNHMKANFEFQIFLQALESAKPEKGARILVLNASGGVGSMAVQLAKALYDAYVVGVTGPKNLDFVKVGNQGVLRQWSLDLGMRPAVRW